MALSFDVRVFEEAIVKAPLPSSSKSDLIVTAPATSEDWFRVTPLFASISKEPSISITPF